eukprot:2011513-Rhodomonas_salina.1
MARRDGRAGGAGPVVIAVPVFVGEGLVVDVVDPPLLPAPLHRAPLLRCHGAVRQRKEVQLIREHSAPPLLDLHIRPPAPITIRSATVAGSVTIRVRVRGATKKLTSVQVKSRTGRSRARATAMRVEVLECSMMKRKEGCQ